MPDALPLLPLPTPLRVAYRPPFGGGAGVRLPGGARQIARLGPKFNALRQAIEAERARLLADPAGVAPENVIVFESVEPVETLQRAISRMPGMEFLADWEGDDAPPDEDFSVAGNDPNKPVPQRLYLVLLNQQAITELLSLWQRYRADPERRFRPTMEPWRSLFRRLRDVRRWGPRDRLLDTGILDYWRSAVQEGRTRVLFEAELWCRQNEDLRRQAASRVEQIVRAEGGTVVGQHVVEQIAYHGVLIDAPITTIQPILDAPQTRLVLADEIMLFRPSGQAAVPLVQLPEADEPVQPPSPVPTLPPTVAVLDGLPLQNHAVLRGRLDVDDPEGLEATYEAADRQHGTAVASLIAHGCLNSGEPPLERRIYVRPITRPDPADARPPRAERIPFGRLTLDVFHEAVRRLISFRQDGTSQRGDIFIVNVSLGDGRQPFLHRVSPWARLLDWLAAEYNLLFVVSAGNCGDDITLSIPRDQLDGLAPEQRRATTIEALAQQQRHRRILSPSEAVNVLTIGALHADWCNGWPPVDRWIDLIGEPTLPSPYSRLGLGFRSAIKPEVLVPGGRQLYQRAIAQNGDGTTVEIVQSRVAPGVKVASPAAGTQAATGTRHDRGTSYAAALATRASARLFDAASSSLALAGVTVPGIRHRAVVTKAMFVHGARWDASFGTLERIIGNGMDRRQRKINAARYLGYGALDLTRSDRSTERRATLIGWGDLSDEETDEFVLPLPPSLSGQRGLRRLTVTLAWFSPMNPRHQLYRRAKLWFDGKFGDYRLSRVDADDKAVKRGTVQHEVLQGTDAIAFTDGEVIGIRVSAKSDAGGFEGTVPYGLAVSLEVGNEITIPLFEEVRTRIQQRIRV